MPSLLHHPLDPSSRLIRLMCAEYGVPLDMEEIKPWLRTQELLEQTARSAGNPALRAYAQKMLPTVSRHLDQAQQQTGRQ